MEFLTVNQVAELLQVRPRTVRKYLREKELMGVNMGSEGSGNRWRITKEAINQFAQERLSVRG